MAPLVHPLFSLRSLSLSAPTPTTSHSFPTSIPIPPPSPPADNDDNGTMPGSATGHDEDDGNSEDDGRDNDDDGAWTMAMGFASCWPQVHGSAVGHPRESRSTVG
uniref:Uncharacterized protein n=1 Tax=Oryza barthii TaxID=65489 RepID=A0A0D3F585_9ORYZ